MSFGSAITAKLGLDTKNFRQGVDATKSSMSELSAHAHKHGEEIAKGLNKPLESLEKTERSIGKVSRALLSGFGVIEVWRKATEIFENLSEYAEKFGDKTDANVQASIRWGRAFKESGGDAKNAGVQVLGVFTRMSEAIGTVVSRYAELEGWRAKGSTDAGEAAAEGAAKRDEDFAAYKARNDPDKVNAVHSEREKATRDTKYDGADTGGKLNILLQERLDLSKKIETAGIEILKKEELSLGLEKNKRALEDLEKKALDEKKKKTDEATRGEQRRQELIRTFVEEELTGEDRLFAMKKDILAITQQISATKKDDVQYQDLLTEKTEKQLKYVKELQSQRSAKAKSSAAGGDSSPGDDGKLSLQELANISDFQVGVSASVTNDARSAREALGYKGQAEQARLSGDQQGCSDLMGKFNDTKSGLGSLKDSEKGGSDLKAALQPTNDILKDVQKVLSGKFVTQ